MKVVVQRSKYSKVIVDGKLINEINKGLVLLAKSREKVHHIW